MILLAFMSGLFGGCILGFFTTVYAIKGDYISVEAIEVTHEPMPYHYNHEAADAIISPHVTRETVPESWIAQTPRGEFIQRDPVKEFVEENNGKTIKLADVLDDI